MMIMITLMLILVPTILIVVIVLIVTMKITVIMKITKMMVSFTLEIKKIIIIVKAIKIKWYTVKKMITVLTPTIYEKKYNFNESSNDNKQLMTLKSNFAHYT